MEEKEEKKEKEESKEIFLQANGRTGQSKIEQGVFGPKMSFEEKKWEICF